MNELLRTLWELYGPWGTTLVGAFTVWAGVVIWILVRNDWPREER